MSCTKTCSSVALTQGQVLLELAVTSLAAVLFEVAVCF